MSPLIPIFRDTLAKVHSDAPVVHKNAVAFKVCLLCVAFFGKLYKSVAQAVPGFEVANNACGDDLSKPRKNELQSLLVRHRV